MYTFIARDTVLLHYYGIVSNVNVIDVVSPYVIALHVLTNDH